MKPVVLLVGKLRRVIDDIPRQLDHLPVNWLGAHDHAEVMRQLDTEPGIACVVIGGSLPDDIRGDLVSLIATRRPDICIHVKDRASGPDAMAAFVEKVVRMQFGKERASA
ncbi:hypothetical protein [Shimia biformata]|uniref:hypothetical protein n=1 Tax=Shimia biformata TaxID=1294299 RepID=UPI001950AF13|nr:hypothetical protein [Shimia biformata]